MTTKSAQPGDRPLTLDITVLGREYKVACKEHEHDALVEAVSFLDARMREIRDAGKVAGVERIAVMAALNIANDLLRERRSPAAKAPPPVDQASARRRIDVMQKAIDQVLANT